MALVSNVGSTDKMIRIVVGAILALYAILGAGLGSALGVIALVVGIVLIATGFMNFCPAFKLLGINSLGGSSKS